MKMIFDEVGKRTYNTGISDVALFTQDLQGAYEEGVAWNGVKSINESPSGAEPTKHFADNIEYFSITSAEEFGFSIAAFDCPTVFDKCDGTAELIDGVAGLTIGQQTRRGFGLAYKTKIGTDTNEDAGYYLHIIYGAKASPSERANETVNESTEPQELSWECTSTPVKVEGKKPTAKLRFNSLVMTPEQMKLIEDTIYGVTGADEATSKKPKLPTIAEIATMFAG